MLHQIWFDLSGDGRAAPHVANSQRLRQLHPGMTYKLWNESDALQLVTTSYPQYLNMWNTLPVGINRCDVFRYMALHHYGGAYLDLDFRCTQPLTPLLHEGTVLVGEEWPNSIQTGSLHNGNLYSHTPGHPFWIFLLDEVLRRHTQLRSEGPQVADIQRQVFKLTGTAVLRDSVLMYWAKGGTDVIVLPYYMLSPLCTIDGSLMTSYTHPACTDARLWRLVDTDNLDALESNPIVFTVLVTSAKTWQTGFS